MTEWERDAAEASRFIEEREEMDDYPEEYYREFDLLHAMEQARIEENHRHELFTMDREFPW